MRIHLSIVTLIERVISNIINFNLQFKNEEKYSPYETDTALLLLC